MTVCSRTFRGYGDWQLLKNWFYWLLHIVIGCWLLTPLSQPVEATSPQQNHTAKASHKKHFWHLLRLKTISFTVCLWPHFGLCCGRKTDIHRGLWSILKRSICGLILFLICNNPLTLGTIWDGKKYCYLCHHLNWKGARRDNSTRCSCTSCIV